MPLWNDPQYEALARLSATILGTSDSDIVAAILAQWTCEKGNADEYPPVRNNPGNLARGAAEGLGEPFHIDYPNPQPGNPIVTFDTPRSGARAYAKLLNSGSRYAGVRAAVRAGDGAAFIVAMGKSGYGTGTACMMAAYHPSAPPTDNVPTPKGVDVAISTTGLTLTSDKYVNLPTNTKIYASSSGGDLLTTASGRVDYFGATGGMKAVRVNTPNGTMIGYTNTAASVIEK